MARLEYKYYIPIKYIDSLRRDIAPFLMNDRFAEAHHKKEYTVRSIYMDSYRMHTYQEKILGIKERNKFRVRGYDEPCDNPVVYLEIKRKYNDYISKDRTRIHYANLDSFMQSHSKEYILFKEGQKELAESNAGNFIYYCSLHSLKPTVLITYEREAFECRYGTGLRITFDKNIRSAAVNNFSGLFCEEGLKPVMKDTFVLEVKFHHIVPGWLPRILCNYEVFRNAASKYVMGIDNSYFLNSFIYM